jgi:hypothetical protein
LLCAGQFGALRSEAVRVARRDAVFSGDPLGFEQGKFREAHENRIERAGLETGFAAEFVAVMPGGRALDEAFEDTKGLRR